MDNIAKARSSLFLGSLYFCSKTLGRESRKKQKESETQKRVKKVTRHNH